MAEVYPAELVEGLCHEVTKAVIYLWMFWKASVRCNRLHALLEALAVRNRPHPTPASLALIAPYQEEP